MTKSSTFETTSSELLGNLETLVEERVRRLLEKWGAAPAVSSARSR